MKNCPLKPAKDCITVGKKIYESSKYKSFENLIVRTLVERVIGGRMELSSLSFINPTLIGEVDLEKLIKHFPENKVILFFKESYLLPIHSLNHLLLKKPNLICKFKNNKVFSSHILSLLKNDIRYYQKDFSEFPCNLELDASFDLLLSEIKNQNKKINLNMSICSLF